MATNLEQLAEEIAAELLKSIVDGMYIPKVAVDGGYIRLIVIDRSSNNVYLGFFERDNLTGQSLLKPSVLWTIEITASVEDET